MTPARRAAIDSALSDITSLLIEVDRYVCPHHFERILCSVRILRGFLDNLSDTMLISSAAPPHAEDECFTASLFERLIDDNKGIYLDSGTTSHLFNVNMLQFLHNVRELLVPRCFKGVGGVISCDIIADSKYLADIYLSPDAPKNLISMSQLEDDRFNFAYHSRQIIAFRRGSRPACLTFVRQDSLYVLINASTDALSFLSTLSGSTQPSFRLTDQARAERARDLHVKLGHPGRNHEATLLQRGSIANCPVVYSDFLLADRLLGPCSACVAAKATKPPAGTPSREPSTVIGAVLHIDYLFLRLGGARLTPKLITVDEASNHVCIAHTRSKSARDFAAAFDQVQTFYLKFGHSPCKFLHSDNEASVIAYEPTFGQIIFRAAGVKVALAEGYIRIVKDIIRAILFGLPYKWPPPYLDYLVDEAASMVNLRANSKTGNTPASELVTSLRVNYERLTVPFGAYGMATIPSDRRGSDLDPRAEPAIVLRRFLHGEIRYKVLLIDSLQIVVRKGFRLLTPTSEVISRINSLTASSPSYPPFEIRGAFDE